MKISQETIESLKWAYIPGRSLFHLFKKQKKLKGKVFALLLIVFCFYAMYKSIIAFYYIFT